MADIVMNNEVSLSKGNYKFKQNWWCWKRARFCSMVRHYSSDCVYNLEIDGKQYNEGIIANRNVNVDENVKIILKS